MKFYEKAKQPVFVVEPRSVQLPFRPGSKPNPGDRLTLEATILDVALPPGYTATAVCLSVMGQRSEPWVLCPLSLVEDLLRAAQPALPPPALPDVEVFTVTAVEVQAERLMDVMAKELKAKETP